jgi:hypothetical protein
MPYIDPKIVSEVKKIDLLSYLSAYERGELVSLGSSVYSMRSHDSIKLSNGMWHQFSRGIGGKSALDYFIKVEGMSFSDAVTKIARVARIEKDGLPSITAPDYVRRKPAVHERRTLVLPSKYKDCNRVSRYLKERRCIAPSVIERFIGRGAIYESEYISKVSGKVYANAIFAGFDKDGVIRQVSIRGLESDFKGEAKGSDKRYSFSLMAGGGSDTIHIFESAIDLMSYLTLEEIHGRKNSDCHYVSLSGIYKPKDNTSEWQIPSAIERVLQEHSEIKNAKVHFDNDEAGRLATRSIINAFQELLIHAKDEPPGFGKDFNDYLRHRSREQERVSR